MLIKVTISELGHPPRHEHFVIVREKKGYYRALRQLMMERFGWLSYPQEEPEGTQQGSSIIKLGETKLLTPPKQSYYEVGTTISVTALPTPEILNFTIADDEEQTLTFTNSDLTIEDPGPYYEIDELIFSEFIGICTCGSFYGSKNLFMSFFKNPNQKDDVLSGKELIVRSFLLAEEIIVVNDACDYELSDRGKFFLEVLQCI